MFNELVPAPSAGAVFVFTRSSGIWNLQTSLNASNAEEGDNFGVSVAISGDTLVVGASGEDSNASGGEDDNSARNVGAAYVFTRSGGIWGQQAYLKESTTRIEHVNVVGYGFGTNVAISGDTLVVGDPVDATAYIYTRVGEVWTQRTQLKASNAEQWDDFGFSVAISGDNLVVGAPEEDSSATGGEADNSAPGAGAVYTWQ
ncbi:MAG: FG-GAP repeat protein [Candidatus Thiodiazotropha endolucinida]